MSFTLSAPVEFGVAEYPWERPLGARPRSDGTTEFRVWAPRAESISLRVAGRDVALSDAGYGIYEAVTTALPGDDYWYSVNGQTLPDPASRWQPDGIRGPSRIVELPAPPPGPRAPVMRELVIYELHIGTFTPQGTFDAAIEHLPGLAELGITAIEVMPVAEFPGHHGWGYDGIYLSATHSAYGGPLAFARLVEAAHEAGLAVILDVVYNHVGASGTPALEAFGPYFTDKYETPWGRAMNYDDAECDPVREWVLQSATGWIRDFGVDGLRLDAIHAIVDSSAEHLVEAVARRVHEAREDALVIAESGLNDPRVMRDRAVGGWGCDGAWADDLHHALRALVTDEREGYYEEFGTVAQLAKALHRPHVHDGIYSSFRRRRFGAPADDVPPAPVRRVRPEPRPGRQPRHGRPAAGAGSSAGRLHHPALAVRAPAVHGRGVRRGRAVPVLHRPHRPVDRRRHPRGPAHGVRVVHVVRRGRDPRPAGPGDVRALQAHAHTRSRARRSVRATCSRSAGACRRPIADAIEFDEEARWLLMRRGRFEVIANFSSEPRSVPCRGATVELATHGETTIEDGMVELKPMSGVLLV